MKKLIGLLIAGVMAMPTALAAQETINLTVASSHPTVVPWVGMIKTHFMTRTDEILAKSGKYKIEWNGPCLGRTKVLREEVDKSLRAAFADAADSVSWG